MKDYIKDALKRVGKMMAVSYTKIFGIVFILAGFNEEIIWLLILGVLLVDLTPSFTKMIWENAKYSYQGEKK